MNSKFEISENEMKRNDRKKLKNLTDVESKGELRNVSSNLKKRKIEADVAKFKRLKGLEEGESEEQARESARGKNGSQFLDDISDDEFIVDADHHTLAAKKKKKKHQTFDSGLQETQDIFSIDFDFTEFEKCFSHGSLIEKDKDHDHKIIKTDIPERMQLRSTPVTPATEEELLAEAKWIFTTAFLRKSITIQDYHLKPEFRRAKKGPQTVAKIKAVLDFIRNQNFEVPFIAFYRKEYVLPELNMNDLWKIYYFDAEWCQINRRKEILKNLFQKMKLYQENYIMQNPDAFFEDNMRLIEEEDLKQLETAQSIEELNDAYYHFMLYYGYDIPKMQEVVRKMKKKKHLKEPENRKQEEELVEKLKSAVRSGPYSTCRKAGLEGLAKKFGLTPYRFAKNLSTKCKIYEVDQDPAEPSVAASDYVGKNFQTAEKVLEAAQLMVAIQLAREPLLRKSVRKVYRNTAKISVRPTKKGIKLIDENHDIFTMKYLKDKPIRDLLGDDFLKLSIAENEKLIEITFSDQIEGNASLNYVDQMKRLYIRDEQNKIAQDWNILRTGSVEMALARMVIPDLKKELRTVLLNEARDCVARHSARKMFNWIKVAPYQCSFPGKKGEEWDTSKGHRVMGLAYTPDCAVPAYACVVAPGGECVNQLKLPNILKKKNREAEKIEKEADLLAIKNFILNKKPHVVVIGGESREALMIAEDIKEIVQGLVKDERFPNIRVEIIENELSSTYSKSNKGKADFGDYPELLRQAISLARRLQDPLLEFSQLCNAENEILCLRYHPLQEYLSKEDLLKSIRQEFINRTNEVGVDIDKSIQKLYSINLLQFVSGLGQRKARYLIKTLKQTNQRLENRPQLTTYCHMGPIVFTNCVGFIKIDTNSGLENKTKTFVEALDASRVHPEAYGWAGKMSIDALAYEDEGVNLADALEEILEKPEKLKDLDLVAFAVEFQSQGFGNKCITLYDIRSELNNRYKDLRAPYESPNPEKIFSMLTKETPETFYIGKLMEATVIGISYKKPKNGQMDQVSNSLGTAVGIKVRLENGVSGYIRMENLSDKPVTNLEKKVRIGNKISCRVIKIEVEKFGCECTSKTSDLADHNNKWREQKDPHYDTEMESRDNVSEDEAKKVKAGQVCTRTVKHPSFHNINYQEVDRIMMTMRQGEPIIRPSSKGEDRLTVTWKVTDGIHQHIEIKEVGKESKHTLGRSLWIGNVEFENLDQIIAKYINPMAGYAAELLEFKYYKPSVMGQKDKAEKILKNQKKENPNGIPYIVSAAKQYPGKFMLSYLPRAQVRHEYISVTPEGFKFNNHSFVRVNDLFRWFKENCKDPNPDRSTPNTPRVYNKANGINIGAVSQKVIQKVVQNMPAEMLQTLSQAAQMPQIISKVTQDFTRHSGYKSGQSFELPEKSFGGSRTSLTNSSSRSTSPSGDGTPLYDEKQ